VRPGLRRGARIELTFLVESWMKPHLEGLVKHPLYATWAMVYHMETVSRALLAPYLEKHEEAVGGAVLVKHLGPAGVRARVRVTATLVRTRGSKVWTKLEAFCKDRKIGEGSHLQVVMPRERFARLIRAARAGGRRGHG
jgi:predicted thioesterase